MNKLQPKNRICFQTKALRANLLLYKYRNKKWNLLRKKMRSLPKELRPETKKKFFQQRLIEKQKFQHFYQIKYYQLKNLFKLFSKKKKKNAFQYFMSILDSRLDVSLIRLNIAKSIFQAKQLITHNKITVNKQIVNRNNFYLKKGDLILRNYGSDQFRPQEAQYYREKILSEKKKRKQIFLEKLQKLEKSLQPTEQPESESSNVSTQKKQRSKHSHKSKKRWGNYFS
jgi:ribosomal protein S4